MNGLDRIVRTPGVIAGKVRIRGHRISVAQILGQIGAGATVEEVLTDFPDLEREDVLQAIRYAASRVEDGEISLATA
jgi:uncharacterized protein (DUF433 family)